jgi:hypothetical protein
MALAADRNTLMLEEVLRTPLSLKQKGSTTIYGGSLVALNAGYAAPGAAASGRIAMGRCQKQSVNSGADGVVEVVVMRGIFKWGNNAAGADPVVAADVGGTVYIEDDFNVCHTATGKSAAGKCIRLDSDGVWVETI